MLLNLLETFKFNVLHELKTGNAIIDMLISMVFISMIGYIVNDRRYFYQKLKDISFSLLHKKKVSITYVAKEFGAYAYSQIKTDYPKTYLAILYHINQLSSKDTDILGLREIYKGNGLEMREESEVEVENKIHKIEKKDYCIQYTIHQGIKSLITIFIS